MAPFVKLALFIGIVISSASLTSCGGGGYYGDYYEYEKPYYDDYYEYEKPYYDDYYDYEEPYYDDYYEYEPNYP